MRNLKKFETTAAYQAAQANLITPNVSLIAETHEVEYNPYVYDPYNGHEFVEIGGLKWATMNVGASSVTDGGLFFQWGDTKGYTAAQCGSGEGQKYFGWDDYKYITNAGTSSSAITKYNSTDGKTVLDASDDAAQANWGGSWRMPTIAEFQQLGAACDFITTAGTKITSSNKLTTLSGVTGVLVADKNDYSKRLFFPAVGYCFKGNVKDVAICSSYWSSSVSNSDVGVNFARCSYLDSRYDVYWEYDNWRFGGFSVRGVVG